MAVSRTGRQAISDGRTKQAERSGKRTEILGAASELFAAKGYTGTSMRDIASATGMLAGSLYYHFESKEALAATMVADLRDGILAATQQEADPSDTPIEALRRFANAVADASARHPGALQVCLGIPETQDPELAALLEAEPRWSDRKWQALVKSAEDAGFLRPEVDTRILREVLRVATTHSATLAPTGFSARKVVNCTVDLMFAGLSSKPADGDLSDSAPAKVARKVIASWDRADQVSLSDRQDRILDAARVVFAEKGFDATTTRDIANAVGLTQGSLYHHFESREAILVAVLQIFSARMRDAHEAIGEAGGTPLETVDALIRMRSAAGKRFADEVTILKSWAMLTSKENYDFLKIDGRKVLRVWDRAFAAGVRDGSITMPGSSRLVFQCLGEILWSTHTLPRVSVERLTRYNLETVLWGASPK
ncbi:TetR/AcrR family transcriptional regulator [Prescottella equi]|uniref:TetR family transcriptional regulator n=2 Tax=Rhodococcus hoagii TaxID=43767 RepID=A0AAP2AMS6_RHOHA|nr:TetR/AcrR family transcriptional regulator [Prescottella equi]MBM4627678.1 TetR family transcriptional regulator [Prescottella equi]MBM4726314.1 TetR family transcriptional regulator [Prescottella equi]NKR66298.1 TetR family transcriptional regulator [Prescottella equi]NKR80523.1 TetR family transcriptional regulator [Prescottella equi]NKR93611.1 TetR family transcriptional regulator [Prescottella equi]